MNQNNDDYNKICRTCLAVDNLKPIFIVSDNKMHLANMIMACASIQIHENDGLPSNICSDCITKLMQAYKFKLQCEQSDSFFHTNTVVIKDEELDLTDIKSEVSSEYSMENENNVKPIEKLNQKKTVIFKLKRTDTHNYCRLCKIQFMNRKEFTAHRKEHFKQKTAVCKTCGKTISFKCAYEHLKLHSNQRRLYKCTVCSKNFSSKPNMKRHMRIHLGERPYQCNFCDRTFTQAGSLNNHVRLHTGERPFKCAYCAETFKYSVTFNQHVQNHNPTKTLNTQSPCICDICNKQLSSKGALALHRKRHGDKSFLCTHCGKSFLTNSGLVNHSVLHTGEKPFSCTICGKAFAFKSYLGFHMRIHTGDKRYTCEICDKRFAQGQHLKTHTLLIHKRVKLHKCSFCGKDFALKGNLTVHMRIHTGERPFVCSICDKGFYDSSSRRKHMRCSHPNNN